MPLTLLLARKAMTTASQVRVLHGLDPRVPICVYDLIERCDIELRFLSLPSLEGVYAAGDPPIVAISSMRPSGRQRFSGAHELGHHVFGHATRIDELDSATQRRFEPDEFLVDCFADFLLMPKLAVIIAARARGIRIDQAGPTELFELAGYFGVGYRTLIHHLHRNLGLIAKDHADQLRKTKPSSIRQQLLPDCKSVDVFIADKNWVGRPIDLHVGDFLLVPADCTITSNVLAIDQKNERLVLKGVKPGICRLLQPATDWASYVRIAPRSGDGNFRGRAIFRHEPEVETQSVH